MKTLKQLTEKVNEFVKINKAVKETYPEVQSVSFEIKEVPLKVIKEFAEKHKLNLDYSSYKKALTLNSYYFAAPWYVSISIQSVEVERISPEPLPIDEYREVKKPKTVK